MWDVIYYLFVVLFLVGLTAAGAFLVRAHLSGTPPKEAVAKLFAPRPLPRLDVVEQSSLDGRRRLVLIRRDDVEHLIMTGGPVDMVIETGIQAPQRIAADLIEAPGIEAPGIEASGFEAPGPVLGRGARSRGQIASET